MNTNQLVRKKYVKNRIKKVFIQSNVTIPNVVINGVATALYMMLSLNLRVTIV